MDVENYAVVFGNNCDLVQVGRLGGMIPALAGESAWNSGDVSESLRRYVSHLMSVEVPVCRRSGSKG